MFLIQSDILIGFFIFIKPINISPESLLNYGLISIFE